MYRGVGATRVLYVSTQRGFFASADEADTDRSVGVNADISNLRRFCLGCVLRWEVRPGWCVLYLAFRRNEGCTRRREYISQCTVQN